MSESKCICPKKGEEIPGQNGRAYCPLCGYQTRGPRVIPPPPGQNTTPEVPA